jgi:hypothetical protein
MPKLSIITINYNNLGGASTNRRERREQIWQELEYSVIDEIYTSVFSCCQ